MFRCRHVLPPALGSVEAAEPISQAAGTEIDLSGMTLREGRFVLDRRIDDPVAVPTELLQALGVAAGGTQAVA